MCTMSGSSMSKSQASPLTSVATVTIRGDVEVQSLVLAVALKKKSKKETNQIIIEIFPVNTWPALPPWPIVLLRFAITLSKLMNRRFLYARHMHIMVRKATDKLE